ncbi:hypothetical protein [Anthropogastromicrobium sp.]|uniref:hypothetical protein n=1 Tax=Anthropogastromicrobium sp. TaxID=2981649 RepID=UPI00307CC787
MLKVLVKKELAEIFRSYFYNAKKNKARSKGATVAYFVLFALLMAGVLGGMFAMLAKTLCAPLYAAGLGWLYFAMMGLIAVLLGAFGSVFNTYSTLYLPKDNDLLLSLPIPVSVLMVSRLVTVYLMGLLYSGVVMLPTILVYWVAAAFTLPNLLGGLLLTALISVFVSLVFFAVYYFVVFKAQTLISQLLSNALAFGEAVKGAAYPIYLFGQVGVGDPIPCLVISLVVAALFALIWALISHSFLKLATSTGKSERKVYKETAVRPKSVSLALLGKEFSRFLASPNYMLNCGLGILMLPVCGVALLWKGGALIELLGGVFGEKPGSVPMLLCAMGCMIASMNDMAVPSVSLEGKSLWLMQSLPVKPWQVLRAKLSLQLLLTGIPMLFCLLCLAMVYPFAPLDLLLAAVQTLSFVMLSALFGLFMGLKMPNLNWTQEITVIKQSMGVMIAMFGGWAYTVLFCVGFLLFPGWKLGFAGYMGAFIGLNLVFCGGLYLWLKKRGCGVFAAL